MNEINLSQYDRIMLDEIKYHLEKLVQHMEGAAMPASEWYEVDIGMLDLNGISTLTKCNSLPRLYFYVGGYNEGEITYTKKFETVEARDAEYERLKEKLMAKK